MLIALVCLGVVAGIFLSDPGDAPLGRGAAAPDFSIPLFDVNGKGPDVSLSSFRGKVVLVNFWATWCAPCEKEMPAMERLYRELAPQGFELLAISVDESEADIREFQERLQVSFPILLDPEKKISKRYQTMGYPESLLVDRDGRIIERYVGPKEWDRADYVARIRRLLTAGKSGGG